MTFFIFIKNRRCIFLYTLNDIVDMVTVLATHCSFSNTSIYVEFCLLETISLHFPHFLVSTNEIGLYLLIKVKSGQIYVWH